MVGCYDTSISHNAYLVLYHEFTQQQPYFPRFIDDNSRLEQNIEKRIRHALENVLGLMHSASYTLANAVRQEIFVRKLLQHRV